MTDKVCSVSELRPTRKAFLGYVAGIAAGVAYGLNPLFGVPLLTQFGLEVTTVLFYRYFIAALCLGVWMVFRHLSFKVTWRQGWRLLCLGAFYTASSLTLFLSYHYIPSGIATTLVFLCPVIVALIMVFLKVYPTWQVWLAIILTFVGVVFLCQQTGDAHYHPLGLLLAFLSAVSYSFFIVVINRSKTIRGIPSSVLTFYALVVGALFFFGYAAMTHPVVIPPRAAWADLFGLAICPTLVSTAALACATRLIGATKASVLGVFEPVTAIAVGVVCMGEPFHRYIVVGLCLTMGAIIFMTLSEHRHA